MHEAPTDPLDLPKFSTPEILTPHPFKHGHPCNESTFSNAVREHVALQRPNQEG